MVTTVSGSFTAKGVSATLRLDTAENVSLAISGTYVATVQMERALTRDESAWEVVAGPYSTEDGTEAFVYSGKRGDRLRVRCYAFTSGTVTYSIADEDKVLDVRRRADTGAALQTTKESGETFHGDVAVDGDAAVTGELSVTGAQSTGDGVGAVNGGTVSAVEYGNGAVHKTVLTLTATPITLTDEGGVGQYGGVKIYDFPAGNIVTLGASIDADLTLTETEWLDTAEGDVGLGTTAPDDGNALATTEQNIIATTAIAAMTAQVGPINAQSADQATLGAAGGTDSDLYLNVRIDDNAAHITGGGTITGTVTVVWVNAGDF